MADQSVIDLLKRQHDEVRKQFATVQKASGHQREQAFEELRYLLAVHETAEEEILHPFARREFGDGARVVEARLKEEHEAKELLQQLEKTSVDDAEFQTLLDRLQRAVEEHAGKEETVEFPRVAEAATREQLKGMAAAVQAAEKIAPTHPHPGAESPSRNYLAGPLASVVDRTRDAIRGALH